MCGRFTLRTPTPVLNRRFRVSLSPETGPRYNVAPTQNVAVVRHHENNERVAEMMRWGLVPSWAKELKIGARMINARSETAATKPSFRSAMKRRRCLVLADGYFEWKKMGSKKIPHYIRMDDEAPFAMAGLWDIWKGTREAPLEQPVVSCTILTTDSNELTSDLHDRMPVILREDDWDFWMDREMQEAEPLERLMKPFASDAMQVGTVDTHVNNARNEGPTCIQTPRELF